MNTKNHFSYTYSMMIAFSLVCGVVSIVVQLLEGFEAVGFLLAISGIAGLSGVWKGKGESSPHLPMKSYKTAFEWLLLVIMFTYAFMVTSNGFQIFVRVNEFFSAHWPGLMLSVLCVVLGLSGLQKINQPQID